ncbi:MAG TPA: phosphoribosylglycinamide formyltransferase [Candidatus Krumholzibacteria bacterium]|nr:phosphoribosylglycinamide formyltransferase [Candidatus Krumholzibacteria bacterium]
MSAAKCRIAVLASGRGSNFKALAERCQDSGFSCFVACLVTDNGSAPAVSTAHAFGIPVHVIDAGERRGRLQPGAEAEIVRVCRAADVHLIVLAGFMRILEGELLDNFTGRVMNIHPSLLPSFKGLNAQRQAFEYGVRLAGCTVHFVDASLDGGPIILQAAVPVRDDDDAESLRGRILDEEHRILVRAVDLFARGRLRIDGRRVYGADDSPS